MGKNDLFLEESLTEDFASESDLLEVPLGKRTFLFVGSAVLLVVIIAISRVSFLGFFDSKAYARRAQNNLNEITRIPAPRGLIVDRYGKIIADNRASFRVLLNTSEFISNIALQEETLGAIQTTLGIPREEVIEAVKDKQRNLDTASEPVILATDIGQSELVKLKSFNLKTLEVQNGYSRSYPDGPVFATILGYTGVVSSKDLQKNPSLTGQDIVGKAGLEFEYDDLLRGIQGKIVEYRNAKGEKLGEEAEEESKIGQTLETTLDADLQKYFYDRLTTALRTLERTTAVGIALNPKNGEVLALVSIPSYDNNIFSEPNHAQEIKELLTSPQKPLFDRAISGVYSPGSTIKPLVGVAALKEGVVNPSHSVFSPGYLDVPNPYNPDNPSRFMDWRYQGDVNLYSALAQSSNVYFYAVGGGAFDIKGLGISKLNSWWRLFNLNKKTEIDLPGEVEGFLPSPEWKERISGRPWLLGDTYNVSIGQGDLQITPVELLNYIDAIANGGTIYKLHIKKDNSDVLQDLTYLSPQISEVQKGMVATVEATLGTAHTLVDLPIKVAGKTGSAQIQNNAKENAFFVGYAPRDNPEIAILILVENAKQGSLNAVPVAKDIFQWYYENRLQKD